MQVAALAILRTERAALRKLSPQFGRPRPTGRSGDVALLTVRQGQLAVLLIRREARSFRDQVALPGGFVG